MTTPRQLKRMALAMGQFIDEYERKSRRGLDPNDRWYDRKLESTIKKLDPLLLSTLMTDDLQTDTLDVRIRNATPADSDAIADIYLASRRTHVAFAPLAHPDYDVRLWIATVLLPAGGARVAVAHGRVLGFCATSIETPAPGGAAQAWIDHLYLDPDVVGQGIGSALLAAALRDLPRPVRLYTFAQNTGARRFYERHDFVAIEFGDGSGNEEGCPDVLYELGC
ncbi:GNAT family N-acetyltransferase [Piscinibacterium candidicorallinum]|uniref:GNAT family N-acetyltransferase n=1 Tax=Piscinibacterium candidicorallinum TaxID=1793872 RepID=A0ABV7HBH2_9BURK